MKNKAFLSIIEQLVMLLVFTLAAAICLQGFFTANKISQTRDVLDKAVFSAQTAAEILKSTKGNFSYAASALSGSYEENTLTVYYDAQGKAVHGEDFCYKLTAKKLPAKELCQSAIISLTSDSDTIFELEVTWQRRSQ